MADYVPFNKGISAMDLGGINSQQTARNDAFTDYARQVQAAMQQQQPGANLSFTQTNNPTYTGPQYASVGVPGMSTGRISLYDYDNWRDPNEAARNILSRMGDASPTSAPEVPDWMQNRTSNLAGARNWVDRQKANNVAAPLNSTAASPLIQFAGGQGKPSSNPALASLAQGSSGAGNQSPLAGLQAFLSQLGLGAQRNQMNPFFSGGPSPFQNGMGNYGNGAWGGIGGNNSLSGVAQMLNMVQNLRGQQGQQAQQPIQRKPFLGRPGLGNSLFYPQKYY